MRAAADLEAHKEWLNNFNQRLDKLDQDYCTECGDPILLGTHCQKCGPVTLSQRLRQLTKHISSTCPFRVYAIASYLVHIPLLKLAVLLSAAFGTAFEESLPDPATTRLLCGMIWVFSPVSVWLTASSIVGFAMILLGASFF